MNRRLVLKQLGLVSVAALLVPSCVTDSKKVSIALKSLDVSGDEETLLGNLADVLIPATDSPGARAVEAHLFTLVMVDDCFSEPDKKKFVKGMREFSAATKSISGKDFLNSTAEERVDIITQVEKQLDKIPEDTRFFYSKTRSYIIEGYLYSQHFLTNVKPYQLIPGPVFKGCAPVNTIKTFS